MRCARPAHSPLHCNQNQEDSRRHQSCRGEGGTTAGEFLKPIMWPIIRSTPDSRPGQPQTKKRKCGIQPAHQSLFTDVFGPRLLLCTIHQCKSFTKSPRGDGKPCAVCLTGDIRMGWSGRALAPPAIEARKRHVSDGSFASVGHSADDFRSSPNSGPSQCPSACPKSAMGLNRSRGRGLRLATR